MGQPDSMQAMEKNASQIIMEDRVGQIKKNVDEHSNISNK